VVSFCSFGSGSGFAFVLGACRLRRQTYCLRQHGAICKESTATQTTLRRSISAPSPRINCVPDKLLRPHQAHSLQSHAFSRSLGSFTGTSLSQLRHCYRQLDHHAQRTSVTNIVHVHVRISSTSRVRKATISRTIPDCVCVRHLITYAAAAALSPR
jgi:hypothetical protein